MKTECLLLIQTKRIGQSIKKMEHCWVREKNMAAKIDDRPKNDIAIQQETYIYHMYQNKNHDFYQDSSRIYICIYPILYPRAECKTR